MPESQHISLLHIVAQSRKLCQLGLRLHDVFPVLLGVEVAVGQVGAYSQLSFDFADVFADVDHAGHYFVALAEVVEVDIFYQREGALQLQGSDAVNIWHDFVGLVPQNPHLDHPAPIVVVVIAVAPVADSNSQPHHAASIRILSGAVETTVSP